MGLLDMFKSTPDPDLDAIEPVIALAGPTSIAAPVTGAVIERMDVESRNFSEGLLGRGCGIKPQCEVVYAPVNGTVTVQFAGSRHAIGFAGDNGAQIIIHVGINTVSMEGKGFTYLVEQGATVKAGDPVLAFSREAIAEAKCDDIVTLAVVNADDFAAVNLVQHGHVDAGQILLELTD